MILHMNDDTHARDGLGAGIDLRVGDCLQLMVDVPAGSIDLILCDLPYGTTECAWDAVLPFGTLWAHYRRVLKPRGAVVLTGSHPFTSMLVISNQDWFKYCLVWEKTRPTGFINAKNKPLKSHEDIAVFSPGTTANRSPCRMTYNPQGLIRSPYTYKRPRPATSKPGHYMGTRPGHKAEFDVEFRGYPKSVLKFPNPNCNGFHPTQKPVPLFEYLIRTYSNEGDIVLDNCIGSGTTAIACLNTGRRCIGMDISEEYIAVAKNRVAQAQSQLRIPFDPKYESDGSSHKESQDCQGFFANL